MIVRCENKDRQKILSYIGTDYSRCLYLYLNLQKYSLDSDIIEVYLQEEQEVTAVMLKYYTCLHVYSKNNDFDAAELGSFFADKGLTMFYCMTEIAMRLYSSLPGTIASKATISNGWVAQVRHVDRKAKGLSVPAQEPDFNQIARLIFDDEDIGKSYKYDDLARQLVERNKEGYGRNLVIKDGTTVIAHACTNAEFQNIAVVAELLVRKEYRGKGYASEIWRDLCSKLLSEGKEVYSFYYSQESRELHRAIGFTEVCDWSKIVIAK